MTCPIGSLSAAICLRDFVGRNDLDLSNSCNEGLADGKEWLSGHIDHDAKERMKFGVRGHEAVDVPAGKFNTIKIGGTGKRLNPSGSTEDYVVTYWFAPEVKAMVRTIREYRTADGALIFKITEELTAVKLQLFFARADARLPNF